MWISPNFFNENIKDIKQTLRGIKYPVSLKQKTIIHYY